MKILIIGGTGVLSTAVVAEAINKGVDVTMINRGNHTDKIPQKARLIISDRNRYNYIKEQLEGQTFDAIIDFLCVSEADTLNSISFYSRFAKQYFYISSAAVINTSIGGVYDENSDKPQKLWDYSIHKFKSEQVVVKESKKEGIHYTIVRPCVTYDNTRIPYGISPIYGYHWTLVSRILHNKPIITWNEGKNKCNMMRVEDFAIAFVGLIGNKNAYNKTINICGDESPTFSEVIKCIEDYIGHKATIINIDPYFYAQQVPNKKGEILGGRSLDAVHSNLKLKQLVPDYSQKVFIREGIRRTLKSYRDNNYYKGIDWIFDAECDRVVDQWCKKIGVASDSYNLYFIDYLNNALKKDKQIYFLERYKFKFLIKVYLSFLYFCWRISHLPRKIKKLFISE